MKRNFILILTVLLCWAAIPSFGQAGTSHKVPTAAQVDGKHHHAGNPLNKTGKMSMRDMGMGKNDSKPRWAAAIRHADRRAAHIRKNRTEVK